MKKQLHIMIEEEMLLFLKKMSYEKSVSMASIIVSLLDKYKTKEEGKGKK